MWWQILWVNLSSLKAHITDKTFLKESVRRRRRSIKVCRRNKKDSLINVDSLGISLTSQLGLYSKRPLNSISSLRIQNQAGVKYRELGLGDTLGPRKQDQDNIETLNTWVKVWALTHSSFVKLNWIPQNSYLREKISRHTIR